MNEKEFGKRIVGSARSWLGTPYCHQASVKKFGCDCLGLVRGVWREVVGPEPLNLPAYSRDWGEVTGNEHILANADRIMTRIDTAQAGAGDVIVLRWKKTTIAKHLAILTSPGSFIHSWERAGVCEVQLNGSWKSRIAAAYRFPSFCRGND